MNTFRKLEGIDLLDRTTPFYQWHTTLREKGNWVYLKSSVTAPTPICVVRDERDEVRSGFNVASQDYLSLSSHPLVKAAAHSAIDKYGVHSAGSPAGFGHTEESRVLEQELASFLDAKHVMLFPTGWAAGYGVITGLVRQQDFIIMDRLAHNCLQEGARAATKNVTFFPHLDNAAAASELRRLRTQHPNASVLVVTESLFSMDSDTPDLRELQAICHELQAALLVDVAHDLGCMGENGRGALEEQGMLGKIDLVMGSFSKTFASNGGFLCTNSASVKQYLKIFSSPHIFSNAMSPVQVAVVRKALEVIRSDEGRRLRRQLWTNIEVLRSSLKDNNLSPLGARSPIVPVVVGPESIARTMHRMLLEHGLIVNVIEFPATPIGAARLRMQLSAAHDPERLRTFASQVARILACAQATATEKARL